MSSVSRTKKVDPLTKKVPQNPKYQHVRSGIDTGASLSKYLERLEEIKKNYRFRKDEIFKRMKITTLVHLAVQVYRINQDEDFEFLPDSPTGQRYVADEEFDTQSLPVTESGESIPDTARSTLLSVARGVGELDINQPPTSRPPGADDSLPYLLLDIRDSDDYERCHIIGASCYPKATLSRATNYETKEMRAYRNAPGKVIVLYDEDERWAPQAAETLVQRGYDNLFMLSGGLKVAYKLFPEGLITGAVPPTISGVKCKSQVPAQQQQFDQCDIDKLDMYLDSTLVDKSSGSRLSKTSSRMSTSSVASKQSSRSCTSMNSDKPPFR